MSNMLVNSRMPLRRQLSIQMSNLETLLAVQQIDTDQVSCVWKLTTEFHGKVNQLNDLLMEKLVSEEAAEEELDNELMVQAELKLKYLNLEVRVSRLMASSNMQLSKSSIGETNNENRKQRRLPTIEIPKFNGEIRNWIGWWTQFRGIHNDVDLDQAAKFIYLKQAVQSGTRAADLVNSYPPTEENYNKVIGALQDRFGNKELLIEVYMRELISLMVETAKTEKRKSIDLTKLYDSLESHLRALESLGVTTEKKVTYFLFPMVESCLPIPILRAWQRSPYMPDDGRRTKLERLMEFMRSESEGETRILLSQGFSDISKSKEMKTTTQFKRQTNDLPTAIGLVSLNSPKNFKKKCGFCGGIHNPYECHNASKWSIEERRNQLRENGSCYRCLQPGHLSINCKQNPTCEICNGRHYKILCYRGNQNSTYQDRRLRSLLSTTEDRREDRRLTTLFDNSNQTKDCVSEPQCLNQTCTSKILYPTLMVEIIGKEGLSRKVRVALDTLLGNSFIKEELAKELRLTSLKKVAFNHAIFGGDIKRAEHNLYSIHLSSVSNSFNMKMEAYGQQQICAGIPATVFQTAIPVFNIPFIFATVTP